jgi:hypothetical protein
MADGPNVCRHRRHVPWRKGCLAQRRRYALILLGLRHAVLDRRRKSREAADAPQPMAGIERGHDRAAAGVRPMTPAAGAVARLTMKDPVAERT